MYQNNAESVFNAMNPQIKNNYELITSGNLTEDIIDEILNIIIRLD
jgi:hypothetical protein